MELRDWCPGENKRSFEVEAHSIEFRLEIKRGAFVKHGHIAMADATNSTFSFSAAEFSIWDRNGVPFPCI